MNYSSIVSQIESLLSFEVKLAKRHDLDQIRITVSRAKTLLEDIRAIKNQIEKSKSKHVRREPAWALNP
jgi:hypothetical protein